MLLQIKMGGQVALRVKTSTIPSSTMLDIVTEEI